MSAALHHNHHGADHNEATTDYDESCTTHYQRLRRTLGLSARLRAWCYGVHRPMTDGERAIVASLTRREREVLRWMAKGCDTANVAAYMGVRNNTVRSFTQDIHMKLGTHNRIEAVRRAYELGIVEL